MEALEHAREGMEHAAHGAPEGFSRRVALLVGALAASLAISELQVQRAQNEYLTHHITVSDDWTFYGFKETRARLSEQTVTILNALPGPVDATRQADIAAAQAVVKRMRDGDATGPGTKQIAEKATEEEHLRDHALHRYHLYEYAAGALQIAIVLASASIVARIGIVAVAGGILGVASIVLVAAVAAGMVYTISPGAP